MVINFICRSSRASAKDGLSPIELSVIIEGQRRYLTLDRRIKATTFNPKKQVVKGDKITNEYLEQIKAKCYEIETDMLRQRMLFNVDTFVHAFRHGIKGRDISVFGLFEEYLAKQEQKYDKGLITYAVLTKYRCTVRYCKEAMECDKSLASFSTSDTELIHIYMRERMNNNSSICYMRKLKTILYYAVNESYIAKNPINYPFHKDKVETEPLTLEEVRSIRERDFGNARLNNVRDLFVFQCYTGLAFVDMATLTKSDVKEDKDGELWIVKSRIKTNVRSTIPLLDVAKEILLNYDYELPVLSNQKYNAYLKEIQDVCGIKKKLHSHLARHTCATLLLNAGVDMNVISKVLGHSSTKVTESVYATLMPETIREKVKDASGRIV